MLEAINWTALSFFVSTLALLGNAGVWIYVQVQRKHAATDEQVKDLAERVSIVETQVQALPSSEVWSKIREDLAGIRGDVKASAREIQGLGAGLKRVESQTTMLMENELKGTQRR